MKCNVILEINCPSSSCSIKHRDLNGQVSHSSKIILIIYAFACNQSSPQPNEANQSVMYTHLETSTPTSTPNSTSNLVQVNVMKCEVILRCSFKMNYPSYSGSIAHRDLHIQMSNSKKVALVFSVLACNQSRQQVTKLAGANQLCILPWKP